MEWETKKGWVSKEEGVERDKKGVSEQVRKNWMDASARKRYCPPRPTPSNPHQVHSIASGCNCPDLLDATHSRRHSGERSEKKNGSELGDNWEARFQGSKVPRFPEPCAGMGKKGALKSGLLAITQQLSVMANPINP